MKTCMMGMMVAALAGMAAAQPVQWLVEDGGNGHWYEGVTSDRFLSWSQANVMASAVGGRLLSVANENENDWVYDRIASDVRLWTIDGVYNEYVIGPWFGGRATFSQWRWDDGTPWLFASWFPGEGPGGGSTQQFTHYFSGRGPTITPSKNWGDYFDTPLTKSFVVEWSADCNGDGIVDKGQILSGELADANNNGIPDGPAITSQPTDQASAEGALVSFNVQVVPPPNCTTPVTYRWQRRNPAVPDPTAPGAWFDLVDDANFANTDRSTMTVLRPIPGLATGYRCKIGGGCGCEPGQGGFVYTNTVNFSVACPADFNADGGIDFGDVEAFFERWENGC